MRHDPFDAEARPFVQEDRHFETARREMTELEKIIPYVPRLRPVEQDHPPEMDRAGRTGDWSDILQVVHEAAALVRDSERRAAEQQARADTFMNQTRQELDQTLELLRSAEQRAEIADVRLADLERQLVEAGRRADDWEVRTMDAQAAARASDARCRDAEARADAALARISVALERANAAEAAAAGAEDWLRRIRSTLTEEFPRLRAR